MNARIDLAISAGLAEEPNEDTRPDTAPTGRHPEPLLQRLSAALAQLSVPRPRHGDCPGRAAS